jgi:glutamine amidotransferase
VIAVLDYGIGNLRSAEKAFAALGAPVRLVRRSEEAEGAAGLVLPGVGAFGAAAQALRRTGLEELARDAIRRGVPFLGICVGCQLLFEGSEESPGVEGLGVLPGVVRRLPDGVRRPQMQWNRLERLPGRSSVMLEGLGAEPWVYFVHSYAPELGEDTVAVCRYGGLVAAAFERGTIWATQFHPEKSGRTGLAILAAFARRCGVPLAAAPTEATRSDAAPTDGAAPWGDDADGGRSDVASTEVGCTPEDARS